MTRINDLEGLIRESYQVAAEYEVNLAVSSDARDRHRYRRNIDSEWNQIEAYLGEYLPLCRSTNKLIPDDVRELAARFPRLVAKEFQAAYTTLEEVVPADVTALNQFVWVFERLVRFHGHLNEWKEVHNLLQESMTKLAPLTGELESFLDAPEQWKKSSGLRMWTPCRIELRKLETFMRSVQYVADSITEDGERLRGAQWMINIISIRTELETALREGDHAVVYDSATQLYDTCFDALYQADKNLRDLIGQLNELSTAVKRTMSHENRVQ